MIDLVLNSLQSCQEGRDDVIQNAQPTSLTPTELNAIDVKTNACLFPSLIHAKSFLRSRSNFDADKRVYGDDHAFSRNAVVGYAEEKKKKGKVYASMANDLETRSLSEEKKQAGSNASFLTITAVAMRLRKKKTHLSKEQFKHSFTEAFNE